MNINWELIKTNEMSEEFIENYVGPGRDSFEIGFAYSKLCNKNITDKEVKNSTFKYPDMSLEEVIDSIYEIQNILKLNKNLSPKNREDMENYLKMKNMFR